jgi:hypothetical protein
LIGARSRVMSTPIWLSQPSGAGNHSACQSRGLRVARDRSSDFAAAPVMWPAAAGGFRARGSPRHPDAPLIALRTAERVHLAFGTGRSAEYNSISVANQPQSQHGDFDHPIECALESRAKACDCAPACAVALMRLGEHGIADRHPDFGTLVYGFAQAMALSRAIRSSTGGWVANNASNRAPLNGLTMKRCAVAGLRSAR